MSADHARRRFVESFGTVRQHAAVLNGNANALLMNRQRREVLTNLQEAVGVLIAQGDEYDLAVSPPSPNTTPPPSSGRTRNVSTPAPTAPESENQP